MQKITSCGIDFSVSIADKHDSTNEYGPIFKYLVLVKVGQKGETFDFRSSVNDWEEAHKVKNNKPYQGGPVKENLDFGFALYCFVSDALSGEMSLDEFYEEFGYKDSEMKVSQIIAIHEACKTNAKKVRALIGEADIYDLINDLSERFG